jgi:hypothetical protein
MNINRHNYEEFFLLYVDNELNDADRSEVECFVAANPDLKDELDILLEMKLDPTDISFSDKASLLRFTEERPTLITEENAQYWMLMHLDNELRADEQQQLQQFLRQHPAYQTEFNLLQQTKLEADSSIVFADKAALYREESKVVRFTWFRVAIAAAILLFVSLTIFFQTGSNNQEPAYVKQTTPASNNNVADGQKSSLTDNNDEKKIAAASNSSHEAQNVSNSDIINAGRQVTVPAVANNPTSNNYSDYSHDNKNNPKKVVVQVDYATNNKQNGKKEASEDIIIKAPEQKDNKDIQEDNMASSTINHNTKTDAPANPLKPVVDIDLLKKAAQKDLNDATAVNTNKENDQPVTFTPDEGDNSSNHKKGLRGFFRKVGRTITRNTGLSGNDKENKILIGGLAIAK